MNESHKIFKLKKNLIPNKNLNRCFSFSPDNRKLSINRLNPKKCLSNKSIIGKNTKNKLIQINYKGVTTKIPKVKYYKMKSIDLSKLRVHKIENEELIRQKKIHMEKENDLCSVESLDLIANLKEKEYRDVITKLQKRLINKKIKRREIYDYYKMILKIVKDIENKINSDFQYYQNMTENRINIDIKKLDFDFETKLAKKSELSDYLVYKINEIISKMEIIMKSYNHLINKISNYNEENIYLKKKLKEINEINNKLCFEYKMKRRKMYKTESNLNNEGQKLIFYKKLKKTIIKKTKNYNNNTFLNSDNNGQTYCTSNNINLLTTKNNSKNNFISFSNNYLSTTNISILNRDKLNEKTKERELNYINKLNNKIKNLKNKITNMKTEDNKPKNAFYNLIIKIIQGLNKEEDNNNMKKNNKKIKNENMMIFSYNVKYRNKFMNKLFNDVRLYRILSSKNLEGINYFKVNIIKQN